MVRVRGVCQESICTHISLRRGTDLKVQIIDKTDVCKPTEREAFWAFKLDSFVPKGLNLRDSM